MVNDYTQSKPRGRTTLPTVFEEEAKKASKNDSRNDELLVSGEPFYESDIESGNESDVESDDESDVESDDDVEGESIHAIEEIYDESDVESDDDVEGESTHAIEEIYDESDIESDDESDVESDDDVEGESTHTIEEIYDESDVESDDDVEAESTHALEEICDESDIESDDESDVESDDDVEGETTQVTDDDETYDESDVESDDESDIGSDNDVEGETTEDNDDEEILDESDVELDDDAQGESTQVSHDQEIFNDSDGEPDYDVRGEVTTRVAENDDKINDISSYYDDQGGSTQVTDDDEMFGESDVDLDDEVKGKEAEVDVDGKIEREANNVLEVAKLLSKTQSMCRIPLYKTSYPEAARFDTAFEWTSHMIGEGGFGTVSLGICKADGSRVAIKRLDRGKIPYWVESDDQPGKVIPLEVEMMKKAADIPHIINLVDSFDMGYEYWLIIQYVPDSMDLRQYIDQSEPLAEATSSRIFNQLYKGIMALYEIGIMHRDIKACNVIITPKLEVKVIDFGCSDFLRDGNYECVAGTSAFYPPEYIKDGLYFAGPAAVWSLGIVLAHLLLGVEPIYGRKSEDVGGEEQAEKREDDWVVLGPEGIKRNVDVLLEHSSASASAKNLVEACLEIGVEYRITLEDISRHSWLALK